MARKRIRKNDSPPPINKWKMDDMPVDLVAGVLMVCLLMCTVMQLVKGEYLNFMHSLVIMLIFILILDRFYMTVLMTGLLVGLLGVASYIHSFSIGGLMGIIVWWIYIGLMFPVFLGACFLVYGMYSKRLEDASNNAKNSDYNPPCTCMNPITCKPSTCKCSCYQCTGN